MEEKQTKIYTVLELSQHLKIGDAALYSYIKKGLIKPFKYPDNPRRYFFTDTEVERFILSLQEDTEEPTQQPPTINQQPSTINQQPSTNNQQPIIRNNENF